MSTLYLCAAGNPEAVRLALDVNEASRRWRRIVLLDDDPARIGQDLLGIPVLGPFAALAEHRPGDEAVNLVARTTAGREQARRRIEGFGIPLAQLIHPAVNLRGVTLGRGVTLYEGSTVSAQSTVGDHAVIFTRAVLGHGATLGAGAVLAPGAVINGKVRVGARAYVGTNAAVMPSLVLGEEAMISACSAVICDVPAGAMAMGVPAEIMGGATTEAPAAQPAAHSIQRQCSHAPARNLLLDRVQTIFAAVLGIAAIKPDAGFFEAGGSSSQALELHRQLTQQFGVSLKVVDIFQFLTPRRIAAHLAASTGSPAIHEASTRTSELMRRRKELRGWPGPKVARPPGCQ